MKNLLTIIALVVISNCVYAQKVVPATLTIDSLNKMAKGAYRFYTIQKKDTVDFAKDTIPKCPVIPPERVVVSITMDSTKKFFIKYNRGSSTTL